MKLSYTVYGLRLAGDREVRYIGFTRYDGGWRLRQHMTMAASRNTMLAQWLKENRGKIESFTIWEPSTCDEAVALEHGTIEICIRLGHRLFNRARVPTELQIANESEVA